MDNDLCFKCGGKLHKGGGHGRAGRTLQACSFVYCIKCNVFYKWESWGVKQSEMMGFQKLMLYFMGIKPTSDPVTIEREKPTINEQQKLL